MKSSEVWNGISRGLKIYAARYIDTAMQIAFPDELTSGLDLTPEHVRMDLAMGLYAERRITLGRAAKMAGMAQAVFLRKLGELRISMHYDLPELQADLMGVEGEPFRVCQKSIP